MENISANKRLINNYLNYNTMKNLEVTLEVIETKSQNLLTEVSIENCGQSGGQSGGDGTDILVNLCTCTCCC